VSKSWQSSEQGQVLTTKHAPSEAAQAFLHIVDNNNTKRTGVLKHFVLVCR
jgi:hypothetical protein